MAVRSRLGMMKITIEQFVLHSIPSGADGTVRQESIDGENAVLHYVTSLIEFLRGEPSVRLFKFPEGREPEAKAKLLGLLEADTFHPSASVLAARLHEIQKKVEKGVVHLQSGDLLTVSLSLDGIPMLLLAKLEQMNFLSKYTWQRESGFPFERNRLLKTCFCRMGRGNDGHAFEEIAIYDSNTTLAQFWWRDLLELEEETNNDTNSRRAYGAWKNLLEKSVKPKSESDYHILRNSVAYYFRTQPAYVHPEVVNAILGSYKPEDPAFDVNELRTKANKMPEDSKALLTRFDARFEINHRACNIRLKPLQLTPSVDLVIRTPLEDLKSVVRPEIINQEKGVFIVSDQGWNALSPH